ncbi:DUF6712 family protein [Runella sp. SP2]|uniref:DUF6712 family protein n=1 Tax=Runella sp. SP2 TaxID=2268026 RepID=UPI000F073806|nr:DUF6712 family protein [Runella sp. SP2]AYQ31386.1 hypothetical protein DTQ70_03975 [Runella sp. SP2]
MDLFLSTQHLQEYVAVGSDLSLQTLTPFFRQAESKFIHSTVGRSMWKHIITNAEEEAYEDLIDYARAALANLGVSLYVVTGGAMIDNSGVYFAKTDSMWRPSDKDKAELQRSYYEAGMNSLEDLILLLCDSKENDPYFEAWATSPQVERFNQLLIQTASDFEQHVSLFRSGSTFASLFDLLKTVQNERILPIANGYMDTLLTGTNESDSEPVKAAFKSLKAASSKALALLTTAKALRVGTYARTEMGLTFVAAQVKNANDVVYEYETDGQAALEALRELLEKLQPTGYTPLPAEKATPVRSSTSGIVIA